MQLPLIRAMSPNADLEASIRLTHPTPFLPLYILLVQQGPPCPFVLGILHRFGQLNRDYCADSACSQSKSSARSQHALHQAIVGADCLTANRAAACSVQCVFLHMAELPWQTHTVFEVDQSSRKVTDKPLFMSLGMCKSKCKVLTNSLSVFFMKWNFRSTFARSSIELAQKVCRCQIINNYYIYI